MAVRVILDLNTTPNVLTPADAVVVVGSGAAGMALAEHLADAGRPVVLLESGADLRKVAGAPGAADELNQAVNLGLPYNGPVNGRSRNLGGTTQLWHGQCMRLHEIDLRERPWITDSGWPMTLSELDEPYAAAERWLGVTGSGYGSERWTEHPDLPPIEWNPEYLLHDFTEYTPKPMLGREHRPGLMDNPLVQVVVNATVSRVLLENDRLVGAEVLDGNRRPVVFRSTQVVLAAGAIENARLLQLSDPAGVGLGTGREHTGRYLQDHPIIRTAQVIPTDYRVLQDRYIALHKGNRRLFPKVRLSPRAQEEHGLLDATAVFVHEHDEQALAAARRLLVAARTRRVPEHALRDVLSALRAPVPVVRDSYRRYASGRSTGARPSAVWLQLWLEQPPDPQSRITLGEQTDSLGLRRAEVQWKVSDQELETSRKLTRWVAEDLTRLGLAQVVELPAMHDDDAWRAGVTDAFHPSGTTRMSQDPTHGVVDRDLQVHGVPGLYVVGGSVFPSGGYANPTLTIVALALRLADRLATARTTVG